MTVVEHGAEACNYLLAVDVEMNTVGGYEMSSWERGYGDFEMQPDFRTLRSIPWLEGTAATELEFILFKTPYMAKFNEREGSSCHIHLSLRREDGTPLFGEDVVSHYLNYARVELAAFDSAVTDWERRRGFERL